MAVQPLRVAAWIELQQRRSTQRQPLKRLAALRHFFDWLVTGLRWWPANPAGSSPRPRRTPYVQDADWR